MKTGEGVSKVLGSERGLGRAAPPSCGGKKGNGLPLDDSGKKKRKVFGRGGKITSDVKSKIH